MIIMTAIPQGWRVLNGAVNHPKGYRWICNGLSRFSDKYMAALVPEEVAHEWNTVNRR